ncbi:MAG: UDP-N-acetylmuramate dehydrogenase [Burkholderiaceae bacterium]
MALRIEQAASLRALNSFHVDARAARLATLESPADLDAALALLNAAPRSLVLGGGSNLLLVGDFDGTVLRIALTGRRIIARDPDGALVEAEAGENWHAFVDWTLGQGLFGLENLSLIPGTVGASPIQNIGAYGVEICEHFESLEAVDRRTGRRHRLLAPDCRFGYRDSIFKHPEGARWLILSVRFRLASRYVPQLDYAPLRQALAQRQAATGQPAASEPDAHTVAAAVVAIRQARLPDPDRLGNAGSFFRNPIVAARQAEALMRDWPGLPCHRSADGVKLSAAWLIERCGWKGYRAGDAGVHARHALVLVNHGQATGVELLALAERIQASVRERFGVELVPEPGIVR